MMENHSIVGLQIPSWNKPASNGFAHSFRLNDSQIFAADDSEKFSFVGSKDRDDVTNTQIDDLITILDDSYSPAETLCDEDFSIFHPDQIVQDISRASMFQHKPQPARTDDQSIDDFLANFRDNRDSIMEFVSLNDCDEAGERGFPTEELLAAFISMAPIHQRRSSARTPSPTKDETSTGLIECRESQTSCKRSSPLPEESTRSVRPRLSAEGTSKRLPDADTSLLDGAQRRSALSETILALLNSAMSGAESTGAKLAVAVPSSPTLTAAVAPEPIADHDAASGSSSDSDGHAEQRPSASADPPPAAAGRRRRNGKLSQEERRERRRRQNREAQRRFRERSGKSPAARPRAARQEAAADAGLAAARTRR
jgi:hypothetical protein